MTPASTTSPSSPITRPSPASSSPPLRFKRAALPQALALLSLILTGSGCHALVAHHAYQPPNRQPLLKHLTLPDEERDQPEGSEPLRVELDNGVTLHADLYAPLPLKPGRGHDRDRLALVLHTYAHSARQPALRPWIQAFREAGYTVLAPDLPGHGRSSPTRPTFGPREAQCIAALLNHLEEKSSGTVNRPLVLFGISYGATTALYLTAYPELLDRSIALITLAPFADPNAAIASYSRHAAHPWLLLTPSSWIAAAARSRQEAAIRAGDRRQLNEHGGRTTYGIPFGNQAPFSVAPKLPPALPWLILHGLNDRHAPPSNAQALFDARPQNTTLELIPDRDHHSLLLSPEAYLIPRVLQFIRDAHNPR
ncbi:MAG: alpha/beta fold hydrolase [Planctomycetota bacterium]